MRTALVGDSNYAEFEVLNEYLSVRGFEVHWVKSGLDAIAAFEELQPSLMILDALIPGLTGIKVCQRVRKMPGGEQVKTVLLSKVYRQFQKHYEERSKLGVDGYSAKPINIDELDKLLQKLMGDTVLLEKEPELQVIKVEPAAPAVAPEPVPDETRRKLGKSGNLSQTPFPKLMYFIFKFRRTGALKLIHEHISKIIYFQKGEPVFVTSSLSNESLGRFMVSRGMLSVESYNSSLERMLATGKQHGTVLIEMGILSPHQLYEVLVAQVREKILRIFAWDEGEYEFRPGTFNIDESMQLKLPALGVIFEGIRRFYTLPRLEKYFNEYKNEHLRRLSGAIRNEIETIFKPHEAKFIRLIDGKLSVGKIIARSNLSLSETFQILYFLLLTEVVSFIGDPGFSERGEGKQAAFVEGKKKRRETLRRISTDKEGVQISRRAKFRRTVARAYEIINKLNYYEQLNLKPGASSEEIRQAYHLLTRRYRPYEFYSEADEALKAKSDHLFNVLTNAYENLLDPNKRQSYDAVVSETPAAPPPPPPVEEAPSAEAPLVFEDEADYAATTPSAEEPLEGPEFKWDAAEEFAVEQERDTERPLEAFEETVDESSLREAGEVTASMANLVKSELLFQQGEDALNEKAYSEAREFFRQAMELNPKEAEYHAYLGWATFREKSNDPQAVSRGRDLLEQAISINPGLDSGHTFLGRLLLYLGQKDRAREYFSKAVQYNPENQQAMMELKKLEVG